ncbi:ferrochelatase [Georgenia subflava]|uniref:Coproporphyrin III ferrochelatase n=1 Tax=Georgenia subflava TaxID=1622177 RepID=A0A6N7EKW0_9MICO|nr:ferrochelatase [Georgenia subflava]MPV38779.1 ferrochelatase [Georgenia subflava]
MTSLTPYDAVLLLSFGGPEAPEDVVPFLRNVTAGRGIPDARLEEVGEHYYAFGGKSPINDQNRALLAALRTDMDSRGIDVPVVWGNRNWDPYLTDVLRDLHDDGARRVLTVVTSAYASYSGCRQYRENIAEALATLAAEGRDLEVDKVRPYYNHPGFVAANVDAVVAAYRRLATARPGDAPLVLVTHSIPTAMETASGAQAPGGATYSAQHLDVGALIAAEAGRRLGHELTWQLTYCSRSGNPATPWLEPDVNDALAELHRGGTAAVVLAPIGFVSDHMEVIYDLDTEARATAEDLGMAMERAATVGTAPAFVSALVDLFVERAGTERGEDPVRPAVGAVGPWHDVCPPGCCLLRDGEESTVPAACELTPAVP